MACNTNNDSNKLGKEAKNQFVTKLYDILEDGNNSEFISWSSDGLALLIKDPKQILEKVLPKYFSLTNYASFLRQFCFYGFKKVSRYEIMGKYCGYQHPNFRQGRRDLIGFITRKKAHGPKHEQPAREMEATTTTTSQAFKLAREEGRLHHELELCHEVIKKLEYENGFLRKVMERYKEIETRKHLDCGYDNGYSYGYGSQYGMENGTHHWQIAPHIIQKNNSHLQDGNWEGLAETNMNQKKCQETSRPSGVNFMNEPLNRDISQWFGRDQEQEALPFQEYSGFPRNNSDFPNPYKMSTRFLKETEQ